MAFSRDYRTDGNAHGEPASDGMADLAREAYDDEMRSLAPPHSEGPFIVVEGTVLASENDDEGDPERDDKAHSWVGEFYGRMKEADARFAARAMNAHKALIASVKELLDEHTADGFLRREADFHAETGLVRPSGMAPRAESEAYHRAHGDWLHKRMKAKQKRAEEALRIAEEGA
jgi:hypothetical protein